MARKGENIYHRKDGRWEGRFPKGREGGKTRFGYVFGRSYQEAKEKLLAARTSWKARCQAEARRDETLGAVSAMWLFDLGKFLKESTTAKYREYLDYYILPSLGAMPMEAVTDEDVAALFHRLSHSGGKEGKGLAAQTVSEVRRLLEAVKEYAARTGCAADFSLPPPTARRRREPPGVLGEGDWGRLRAYLGSARSSIHAGILIAMMTGVRIGELCALRWEDVSLPERELHVHKTLQRIRDGSGTAKTKIIITTPKSDSANRTLPLPEALCGYMAPLRRKGAYLLTGGEKPIEPRTMRRKFKAVLEKCGIGPVPFHTLRHTFATRCVESGVDPKCLSVLLGHADVGITFNRYVHPTMAAKRQSMEKFLAACARNPNSRES